MNSPSPHNKLLSIIVPVFNEEQTVATVLERINGVNLGKWRKEIVLVDDGSRDRSLQKVRDMKDQIDIPLTVRVHPKNRGKGGAVRTALKEVKGDYVFIQDADLEYDPRQIPLLLEKTKQAEVVYGNRIGNDSIYSLGTKIISFFLALLYGAEIKDPYTCYKLIPTGLMRSLNLQSSGFEIEAEITTNLLDRGRSITEVPVKYCPRTVGQGKKIRFKDGLIGLFTLFREYFERK